MNATVLAAPAMPRRLRVVAPWPGQPNRKSRPKLDPCGVASKATLFERLETIGELAPEAPLSFLVVRVHGMGDGVALSDDAHDRLTSVARLTQKLTRPTDFVGRLGPTSFGVVLQGTGSGSAGAIASRLGHQLRALAPCRPPLSVTVSAASGTGCNALTLPRAAMDGLEDCC